MCEIRRFRCPSCRREKWHCTKLAGICDSMEPGTRCPRETCLFVGEMEGQAPWAEKACNECIIGRLGGTDTQEGRGAVARWQAEGPGLVTAVVARISYLGKERIEPDDVQRWRQRNGREGQRQRRVGPTTRSQLRQNPGNLYQPPRGHGQPLPNPQRSMAPPPRLFAQALQNPYSQANYASGSGRFQNNSQAQQDFSFGMQPVDPALSQVPNAPYNPQHEEVYTQAGSQNQYNQTIHGDPDPLPLFGDDEFFQRFPNQDFSS